MQCSTWYPRTHNDIATPVSRQAKPVASPEKVILYPLPPNLCLDMIHSRLLQFRPGSFGQQGDLAAGASVLLCELLPEAAAS